MRLTKTVWMGLDSYVWDVGAGLPLLLEDGTASYLYGPGGMVLAQVQAGGTAYYYHPDQLGSSRALTDGTGAVVRTYTYDAYGSVTASTGTVTNRFGYAGAYTDATGFLYLRARYYDPATQQFLTVDPLLAATEQAYNYVGGNPLNATDPAGLYATTEPRGGGGGDRIANAVGEFGLYSRGGFAPISGQTFLVREQLKREAAYAAQLARAQLQARGAMTAPKGKIMGPYCTIVKEYDIIPYNEFNGKVSGGGFEMHHGILDIWALENGLIGYSSKNAPTIILSKINHQTTKDWFANWRIARTGSLTGPVDWKNMSADEAFSMAENMLNAANVPRWAREVYYSEFNRFINGGR